MKRKYNKGDYREFEIALTERIRYILGIDKSDIYFLDNESDYNEHPWPEYRQKEAELICDSLLEGMFEARKVDFNTRLSIFEYNRGNRIKAIKMYRKVGMTVKEASEGLRRLVCLS